MDSLKGKVAVVTGGASGIGLSAAELFSRRGAAVAILDIQDEAGTKAAEEIERGGGKALYLHCDMADEKSIADAMGAVCRHFGRVDILVGNAGIAEKKSMLEELDTAAFLKVLAVDLTGVVLSNKYAVKYMLQNEGECKGAVVNVASILGMVGSAMSTAYPASKAAVINFTRAQAVTYGKLGIRFNAVSPGYVKTPLLRDLPPGLVESRIEKHPIGRLGRPEEIAEAIVVLASPAASFVTGANLAVDGGYTAQ